MTATDTPQLDADLAAVVQAAYGATATGPAVVDASIAKQHGWQVVGIAPHALDIVHADGTTISLVYSRTTNNVLYGTHTTAAGRGARITALPGATRRDCAVWLITRK